MGMPAHRRLLHDDVVGALQMSDQPLRHDPGHECVGVVDPFPAFGFQREGETIRQLLGIDRQDEGCRGRPSADDSATDGTKQEHSVGGGPNYPILYPPLISPSAIVGLVSGLVSGFCAPNPAFLGLFVPVSITRL
jgi:hypothetical protein